MQWPSLPPTTLPTPENLTKDLAAFQKATAYFNNNGTDPEQQETQPDPELNAMWNKLVLLISNDTNGYKMTTVEALTHGKGTGRLVYGKRTAMAVASRSMVQKLHEQSLAKDAGLAKEASEKIRNFFDVTAGWKKHPALPIEFTAEIADLISQLGPVAKHPFNAEYVHKIGQEAQYAHVRDVMLVQNLGTKFDKTRVRNCTYLYSTQLRGRQDFNLLMRTQTTFWPNSRKTNRLDKELTIEFKKIQDIVRDVGYVGVRVLVLTLWTRYLRECVNNCVRTQLIMNYETPHYVSLDTQNRRTQPENEQNSFLVRRWTTAYEMQCDETRHHVLLNTQNRTIPPKIEREKLVKYLRATMYENRSVGVSKVQYVGTSVRVLQRIETEKMRAHTRISERTQTVTNEEDCQNKSPIEYNKIKDMNASERTRISNLTTHLLNLKTFLLRVTQEYQLEKATLCLTENCIFSLALIIFAERCDLTMVRARGW